MTRWGAVGCRNFGVLFFYYFYIYYGFVLGFCVISIKAEKV